MYQTNSLVRRVGGLVAAGLVTCCFEQFILVMPAPAEPGNTAKADGATSSSAEAKSEAKSAKADKTAVEIKNEIDFALDNPDVRVVVKPLVDSRYGVVVSGEVDSDAELTKTKDTVSGLIDRMKAKQKLQIEDANFKALGAPPAPKNPRAATAAAIAAHAQLFLNPDEVKVSAVPLPRRNLYQLKLTGHPYSVEHLTNIRGSFDKIVRSLNDEMEQSFAKDNPSSGAAPKPGQAAPKAGSAKPKPGGDKPQAPAKTPVKAPPQPDRVSRAVDAAELYVTPEVVIQHAFQSVRDTYGIKTAVFQRTSRLIPPGPTGKTPNGQEETHYTTTLHYAVALIGAEDSLEAIHTIERGSLPAIQEANKELGILQTFFRHTRKGTEIDSWPVYAVTGLFTEALTLKDQPGSSASWPISRLGSAGFVDLKTDTTPVDAAVSAINASFGSPDKPVASRDAVAINLSGPLGVVRRIKSLLALEDAAHPQVRLEFWSVQASGKQQDISRDMGTISADIDGTEARIQGLHLVLHDALVLSMISNDAGKDVFFCRLYAQMFGLQPWEARAEIENTFAMLVQNGDEAAYPEPYRIKPTIRDFTTDEALILLGVLKDRNLSNTWLRFCADRYRYECVQGLYEAERQNSSANPDGLLFLYAALPTNSRLAITSGLSSGSLNQLPIERNDQDLKAALGSPGAASTFAQFSSRLEKGALSLLAASETGLKRPGQGERNQKQEAPVTAGLRPEEIALALRSLQDEDRVPAFENLTRTLNPDFAGPTHTNVNGFLTSLHDYYDFVRALGVYTFPQGRIIRKPGQDNADFPVLHDPRPGAAPNAQDYYARRYFMDRDEVPISENPEDTANALNDAPDNLARASDTTDDLLASVIDALQADIDRMYLTPLRNRISGNEGNPVRRSGITLGARTSLAVSDHQQASQIATMYSYAETSAPAPFNIETLLGSAEPAGAAATGLSRLISGLPLAQRTAIAAALQSDVVPNFAQVAPGVSVVATPSSSLSGSSADLKLDTTFGVPAVPPDDKSNPDVYQVARPSGIAADHVTTRIDVNGFRLFNISSENIHTSVPQGNTGIPILDRLPIFGQIFQWPLSPKQSEHQSLLLVNAVIVPKALRLANFYGAVAAHNHDPDPNDNPLLSLSK